MVNQIHNYKKIHEKKPYFAKEIIK